MNTTTYVYVEESEKVSTYLGCIQRLFLSHDQSIPDRYILQVILKNQTNEEVFSLSHTSSSKNSRL